MKKVFSLILAITLVAESSLVFGDSVPSSVAIPSEINGKSYFTQCEHLMAITGRKAHETVEDKFAAFADQPEKMAQLLKDYDMIFNKTFAEALALEVTQGKVLVGGKLMRKLIAVSRLPPDEFKTFVWKVVDTVVELRAKNKSDSRGQIIYLQGKQFVEALKRSPQRPLAEALFSVIVRHSLINEANSLFVGWRKELEEKTLTVGNILGIIGGLGLGLYWASLPGGDAFGGIIMGGLFGYAFGGMAPALGVLGGTSLYVRSRTSDFDPVSFAFLTKLDEEEKFVSFNAFDYLKEYRVRPDKPVELLSIDSGCKGDVCKFTPVQLAYLGHIDFLEIEALNESLKEAMKSVSREEEIAALDTAARSILENPMSYIAQMKLKMAIGKFSDKMTGILNQQRLVVKSLTDYIQKLKSTDLEFVTKKPYSVVPKTDEELVKNGLLLDKVETDLKNLESIQLNSNAIFRKLELTEKVVQNLSALLNSLPQEKEGWRAAAENVITSLDELK